MDKILSIISDIIQVGTFFNFDKITGIANTSGFTVIVVIAASYVSHRRKNKEIRSMQSEIDKMAREIRLLREDALSKKGLSRKEISKIFPPDDQRKTRGKK